MQKIIFLTSRLIFVSLIILVSFGMLLWEFKELSSMEKEKKLALYSISDLSTGGKELVVGQANNELEEKDSYIKSKVSVGDARPIIIKRYLQKYKSPLEPYSDLIFDLSQTYGFDYSYILAIGQQESNLCKKIPENSFNCWGYGIHKRGTLGFDNYEIALRSFAEYLKREYFDKGLDTPEKIMKKYCPHSDGSWAFGVQYFINEIKNGDF
jgi:hypothetical protein